MKPTTFQKKLTRNEQEAIAAAARNAAVALAEFWDVLFVVEGRLGIEFDGTQEFVGEMAAQLDIPPLGGGISKREILDFLSRRIV